MTKIASLIMTLCLETFARIVKSPGQDNVDRGFLYLGVGSTRISGRAVR
jgi:hypothetical protein